MIADMRHHLNLIY